MLAVRRTTERIARLKTARAVPYRSSRIRGQGRTVEFRLAVLEMPFGGPQRKRSVVHVDLAAGARATVLRQLLDDTGNRGVPEAL